MNEQWERWIKWRIEDIEDLRKFYIQLKEIQKISSKPDEYKELLTGTVQEAETIKRKVRVFLSGQEV